LSSDASSVVEVRGVRKEFGDAADRLIALDGIDVTIRAGEFISLIGPSGCGKSTLLRIIGDLTTPTDGTITVNGRTAREARLGRGCHLVGRKRHVRIPVLQDRSVDGNFDDQGAIHREAQSFCKD